MEEPEDAGSRLVASRSVSREGSADRSSARRWLVRLVGVVVLVGASAGLVVQASRGNATVAVQRQPKAVRDAALDNAFYRCLDVQARSLVSPGEPVALAPSNLADFITLLKGVGSWVTIADPPSTAVARLSLRDHVDGSGACLGTQVTARYPRRQGGFAVRVGTGASVPGQGPPPAPPL
jgi:hypothetical protein